MKFSLAFLASAALLCPALLHAEKIEGREIASNSSLPPAGTAAGMKLPEGFKIEVITGEPDVVQPIAYTIDDRGRLWILENTNYPNSPGEAKDRVLVLEDADGDGKFEKRSVFWDKANFSSGIAVGFGGVWLGSPPNLIFIPDKNNDAVPDGPPEILLDGWGAEDTHETLNNFVWGPDGWLYGTHGVFTYSNVGKPGTPKDGRVGINAGVWRYHPTRRVFERWCEGVSNQWGMDWNERGEAFFAACVIPHMWHGIEGAHYRRQGGKHFNPHLYEDIQTIAWGRYEKAANCGAMFYLGGAFPPEWRDNFFFNDIHLSRMRCETMVRDGSGFRSRKKTDFIVSEDNWFRGLSPQYGPDGGVFVNDWYDKVPCHQQKAFTDRSNGRVYKITTDQVKPRVVDLANASDAELVKFQLDPNDWYVRHARRLLQERGPKPETSAALEAILFNNPEETRQLRALWALHSQSALSEATALKAFTAASEHVRGWTATCVSEQGKVSAALMAKLVELASKDPSPLVRLRLASAAQKFPVTDRWPLVTALASHEEDIGDRNLPLMNWYAAETCVSAAPSRGVELLRSTPQPKLHEFIARRVLTASLEDPEKNAAAIAALVAVLPEGNSAKRASILHGMLDGAKGQKQLAEPRGWAKTYEALRADKDASVREQARVLALLFGSDAALGELRALLSNSAASIAQRIDAIEVLGFRADAASLDPMLALLASPGPLRAPVLRVLAGYEDRRIPPIVLADYLSMDASEKAIALGSLVARREGLDAVMAAFDQGKLPKKDLTPSLARLIHAWQKAPFDEWLRKNFGAINATAPEREAEIERYKKFLDPDAILKADRKNGRAIFQRTCSACHEIFGAGGHIGPELPGNFTDINYLLRNVLDPNAEIGKDFQQTFITTKNGSLIAGVIIAEDAKSVTLKTIAQPVTIAPDDIAKRELSPLSMMPEGLLNSLQEAEVRDLFLYLRQSMDDGK